MRKQVNYLEFCKYYGLDSESNDVKIRYQAYCDNLAVVNNALSDDIAEKAIKKTWGGEREGAGRPALRGETIVKRIPSRYKKAVEALIEHLDNTRGKAGAGGYTSKTQCRNLNDTLITLQFQSNSRKTEM